MESDSPRLLAGLRPAQGVIKADYEDFQVDEVPLYAADGEGSHTYFWLEKRGLSTMQAVADVARALEVTQRDIGYAGLKDARAATRQWMSVEHIEPERLLALEIPRIQILEVTRHRNKLRLGHLRGNRFVIKVRQTEPDRLAELQDGLRKLVQEGVPNYFGQQRFGGRGDTWEIGRAVVRDEIEDALDLVLGRVSKLDDGEIRKARAAYDREDYAAALKAWPWMFREPRRALKALLRTKGKKRRAFFAISKSMRNFYISAYQSHLFNQVVAARIGDGLRKLVAGDLAWRHPTGSVFLVEDPEAEQPRADAFEISPSGPLLGYRMSEPSGDAGEAERRVFEAEGITAEAFRGERLRVKGARRPLRFPVEGASIKVGADDRGAYLEFRFELPSGCYATSLLRELFVDFPAEEHGDRPKRG